MDNQEVFRSFGIQLKSGSCELEKTEEKRLIGISIGGGAPRCPCVYVMQVFDGGLAAADGSLSAGDEILSINGESVAEKTKVEVANLIQSASNKVTIQYNKLDILKKDEKSFDIILKKIKHRFVESISSNTADSLGLSRAILCKDEMIKKLEELQRLGDFYRDFIGHVRAMMRRIYRLVIVHRSFGCVFSDIGARDPQLEASLAFTEFGSVHRKMEKFGFDFLIALKPLILNLRTFLTKIIPDVRLTIEKYADAKFEYLSYCLKVKEMDDEEIDYAMMNDSLSRVRLGNYQYRIILLCREMARKRFSRLRLDVFEKLELVEQKNVQTLAEQVSLFIGALEKYHNSSYEIMKDIKLFPIEINFKVKQPTIDFDENPDDDEETNDQHFLTEKSSDLFEHLQ